MKRLRRLGADWPVKVRLEADTSPEEFGAFTVLTGKEWIMSDQEFKIEDDVQLKSGGPEMTIADCYKDGSLKCMWFDDPAQVSGNFVSATLTRVG